MSLRASTIFIYSIQHILETYTSSIPRNRNSGGGDQIIKTSTDNPVIMVFKIVMIDMLQKIQEEN